MATAAQDTRSDFASETPEARERRLAWERARIAEGDADIADGRFIADEDLDGWLADLVAGKPVSIP